MSYAYPSPLLMVTPGDNSQGALQALLSRISMESNPSPIIASDTARSLIRGPKLSTGTQSDMESVWRPEIASPSSSITFRLPRDIQPIYSVTESGNMILEGSNLNQAIEVCSYYNQSGCCFLAVYFSSNLCHFVMASAR